MNEFATPKMHYSGYTYWITGEVPKKNTQVGKYRYYIVKPNSKKPVESESEFGSVVPANQAARAAIDADVLANSQQAKTTTAKNQRSKKA